MTAQCAFTSPLRLRVEFRSVATGRTVHELRQLGVHAEGSEVLVLDEILVAAPALGCGVAAALASSVARSARILSRRASFLRR